MRPLAIVEVQIPTERSTCLVNCVVGMQIDFLVLDRSPQSLDKDIITPRAAAIHADRDRVLQQQAGECGASELAALVGIQNSGILPSIKVLRSPFTIRIIRTAANAPR
jgi:hypothetical protein